MKFLELSNEIQERIIDDYSDNNLLHYDDWYEWILDDFIDVCKSKFYFDIDINQITFDIGRGQYFNIGKIYPDSLLYDNEIFFLGNRLLDFFNIEICMYFTPLKSDEQNIDVSCFGLEFTAWGENNYDIANLSFNFGERFNSQIKYFFDALFFKKHINYNLSKSIMCFVDKIYDKIIEFINLCDKTLVTLYEQYFSFWEDENIKDYIISEDFDYDKKGNII